MVLFCGAKGVIIYYYNCHPLLVFGLVSQMDKSSDVTSQEKKRRIYKWLYFLDLFWVVLIMSTY